MGLFGRPDTGERVKQPPRVTRAEKFAAYPEWLSRIGARWGEKHPGRALRAQAGSLPALIELKCLDCCCGQRAEVRDCQIVACPLYPVRPFQRDEDDDQAEEGGDL